MVSSQQLQSSGKPRGKDNMLGRTALLTLMGLSMAHLPAAAETIRIACQDNFPPFVDVKDGKPVGLVVDILTAAAARENFEVQFVLDADGVELHAVGVLDSAQLGGEVTRKLRKRAGRPRAA